MSSKRHPPPSHGAPPENEALQPSAEPRPVSNHSAQEGRRIGDILRRVREHRGETVEEISDYLRIRAHYLAALENSQYSELPADAYVIGFLRTYALYLGLDGRGAVDQYRREMVGRRAKPQLSMPQPMSEGQAPTVALLVGAAVAAVLIYLLWYWLSSPDSAVTEKPIALPQTVQEVAPPLTQDAGIALTATSASSSLQDITPVVIQPAETAPPEADKSKTKPVETPSAAPASTAALHAETATGAAQTQATGTPAPATLPKDAKKAEETPPLPPKDDKPKSGLVIRADKESWVLITDSKGVTVFDRTLKAGETYQVPAGKGYSLTTGNASGIAFISSGVELPKLQASTPVVRAMPLDSDKIKARLTKTQPDPAE